MNDPVRLRPVAEADLPILARLQGEPALSGPFQWFGFYRFGGPAALRQRWTENGLIGQERGLLVVARADDPALIGEVSWGSHGLHGGCWTIGCTILPEWRGRGYGASAQRCLARYLFAHTQVQRIEAYTEAGNPAEQRALEKAGFRRESVVRGSLFRAGRWHDLVLFGLLRSDLEQSG